MCLIVFAYRVIPGTTLLLAGNRDEFYNRPARPVHKWNTSPEIIAGKDLKEGGTWLGIAENGRFATLTNYRDINNIKENAPSRGELVTNLLKSPAEPNRFMASLKNDANMYNGFNLLSFDGHNMWYMNNQESKLRQLSPGFYSISNAFLNSSWPKTEDALNRFTSIIDNHGIDYERIFDSLLNSETYPREQLPETGLTDEMEEAVSSVFIQTENYGTRCSTIVEIGDDNRYSLAERTYEPGSKNVTTEKKLSIRL